MRFSRFFADQGPLTPVRPAPRWPCPSAALPRERRERARRPPPPASAPASLLSTAHPAPGPARPPGPLAGGHVAPVRAGRPDDVSAWKSLQEGRKRQRPARPTGSGSLFWACSITNSLLQRFPLWAWHNPKEAETVCRPHPWPLPGPGHEAHPGGLWWVSGSDPQTRRWAHLHGAEAGSQLCSCVAMVTQGVRSSRSQETCGESQSHRNVPGVVRLCPGPRGRNESLR